MNCLHCDEPRRIKSRGLCQPCYLKPKIRDLYPKAPCGPSPETVAKKYKGEAKFASRGVGNEPGRTPSYPTSAPPGTEIKLRVMRDRLARGENAIHPLDAKGDANPRGVSVFFGVESVRPDGKHAAAEMPKDEVEDDGD